MPVTEAKFKCKVCNDIFDATSNEYASCKCGESVVLPSQYSTSYKGSANFERLEANTYYFEEDFFILKGNLKDKYNRIVELSKSLNFHCWESTDKGKNGETYLSTISINRSESVSRYSSESNEVTLYFRLNKEYSNPSEKELNMRFDKFIEFLHMVKNGEIELKDRSKLLNVAEEKDVYWSREQIEEYDYSFNF